MLKTLLQLLWTELKSNLLFSEGSSLRSSASLFWKEQRMTDTNTAKLRLVHLLWIILAAVLGAGLSMGAFANQQKTNTAEIEKKVESEVFQIHCENQARQFNQIQETLNRGFEKIDQKLEKMK